MSRKAITLSITGLALVASLGAVSQAEPTTALPARMLFSRFGAARMDSFASWRVRPTSRVARECAI
jgi:hypothetical protein